MRNPSNEDLDNYFDEIINSAHKVRSEKEGKTGASLIFHYLGHGV
jgi:hypothetical protein